VMIVVKELDEKKPAFAGWLQKKRTSK